MISLWRLIGLAKCGDPDPVRRRKFTVVWGVVNETATYDGVLLTAEISAARRLAHLRRWSRLQLIELLGRNLGPQGPDPPPRSLDWRCLSPKKKKKRSLTRILN